MDSTKMEVKGEAILSLPMFMIKKFGKDKYKRWLAGMPPYVRNVYQNPINKNEWFPMQDMIVEPTLQMCELCYNNSLRGAWDCGRFSAEYSLKGIYKVLVKLRSPLVLIKKAQSILPAYYRPCEIDIPEHSKEHVIVHIKKFPNMTKVIEYRIAGWMERAIEITGCKHVTVNITKALSDYDKYTEYVIHWKRGFGK